MKTSQIALAAGAAALALVAVAGWAEAKKPDVHVLTVRLPAGGVEKIRFVGGMAPQIALDPEVAPIALLAPFGASLGPDSPFAMLDRISARMDQELARLIQDADALTTAPLPGEGLLSRADLGPPPADGESFVSVSTVSGGTVCTRTTQVTALGQGQPPKVVSRASGDCTGHAAALAAPTVHYEAAPAAALPAA